MPGKEVKLKGQLEQTKDGFVYVDVPDEIVHGFSAAIDNPDTKKPPYWTKSFNKVGAHISVISKDDAKDLDINEIGTEIEYTLDNMRHLNPAGWDEMSRVYFISVKSPQLESIRKKYGLPAKDHGHEFHITVAVEPKSESIHRLSSLYEESPEGIGFRNAKNLGRKLAKAMGFTFSGGGFASKSRNQAQNSKFRRRVGQAYPNGPGAFNTGSVMKNPRHRKFFGMNKPQQTGA